MPDKESVPPIDNGITLNPGQEVSFTPEVERKYARQKLTLRITRGNILAHSIDIELAINRVIKELLFAVNLTSDKSLESEIERNKTLFSMAVNESGVISFNNKIKVLEILLSEKKIISESERKHLLKLLNEVREVRNKFAHTSIAFEPNNTSEETVLTPYIIKAGKRSYLNEEYFTKLNKVYNDCLIKLDDIAKKANKNG